MMTKKQIQAVTILLVVSMAANAYAAGSNMPWETPLTQILNSATGPVARIGGVLAIIATGLGLAFSEGGGFMRKALCVVFGLSLTFSAAGFISQFLGYGGGIGF